VSHYEQKQFKDFLTPTPLPDESGEWEDVNPKFAISDKMAASKLVVQMKSSKEWWSDEWKLLIIAAFRNSCQQENCDPKLVRKLFNINAVTGRELTGVCILEAWRNHAMTRLE
jgi:hypothetical protein